MNEGPSLIVFVQQNGIIRTNWKLKTVNYKLPLYA